MSLEALADNYHRPWHRQISALGTCKSDQQLFQVVTDGSWQSFVGKWQNACMYTSSSSVTDFSHKELSDPLKEPLQDEEEVMGAGSGEISFVFKS